jgi:hypothetical protein
MPGSCFGGVRIPVQGLHSTLKLATEAAPQRRHPSINQGFKMTLAMWRNAAVTIACACMLQACGGGSDDDKTASPSGQADATASFMGLLETLADGSRLTLVAAMATDPEAGVVTAPGQVCETGSVSELTLNGVAVLGGESLQSTNGPDALHTKFNGCSPKLSEGQQPMPGFPVVTGVADVDFSYAYDFESADGGFTLQSEAALSGLRDATTAVQVHGPVLHMFSQSGPDDRLNVTQVWLPRLGSSLTNMSTGRVANFTSGRYTNTNISNATDETVGQKVILDQLTYTMGGATYVLNGRITDGQGQITLSKNGALTATLTANGATVTATGTVDPL